ncbi:MAG: hypothetical protein ACM31L_16010 [Actinomycetota bacterium]
MARGYSRVWVKDPWDLDEEVRLGQLVDDYHGLEAIFGQDPFKITDRQLFSGKFVRMGLKGFSRPACSVGRVRLDDGRTTFHFSDKPVSKPISKKTVSLARVVDYQQRSGARVLLPMRHELSEVKAAGGKYSRVVSAWVLPRGKHDSPAGRDLAERCGFGADPNRRIAAGKAVDVVIGRGTRNQGCLGARECRELGGKPVGKNAWRFDAKTLAAMDAGTRARVAGSTDTPHRLRQMVRSGNRQLPSAAVDFAMYVERATMSDERRDSEFGRDETGVIELTNIGATTEERLAFWATVVSHERDGGRVQRRQVLELPHDMPPQMWRRILQGYVRYFEEAGLPYYAVVHLPHVDEGSDARNVHVHLLFHERPFIRLGDALWEFDKRRNRAVKDEGWVIMMRSLWSDLTQLPYREAVLLAEQGRGPMPLRPDQLFVPYRLEDMLDTPGLRGQKHLGPTQAERERQGLPTFRGVWNAEQAAERVRAERRRRREHEHRSRFGVDDDLVNLLARPPAAGISAPSAMLRIDLAAEKEVLREEGDRWRDQANLVDGVEIDAWMLTSRASKRIQWLEEARRHLQAVQDRHRARAAMKEPPTEDTAASRRRDAQLIVVDTLLDEARAIRAHLIARGRGPVTGAPMTREHADRLAEALLEQGSVVTALADRVRSLVEQIKAAADGVALGNRPTKFDFRKAPESGHTHAEKHDIDELGGGDDAGVSNAVERLLMEDPDRALSVAGRLAAIAQADVMRERAEEGLPPELRGLSAEVAAMWSAIIDDRVGPRPLPNRTIALPEPPPPTPRATLHKITRLAGAGLIDALAQPAVAPPAEHKSASRRAEDYLCYPQTAKQAEDWAARLKLAADEHVITHMTVTLTAHQVASNSRARSAAEAGIRLLAAEYRARGLDVPADAAAIATSAPQTVDPRRRQGGMGD